MRTFIPLSMKKNIALAWVLVWGVIASLLITLGLGFPRSRGETPPAPTASNASMSDFAARAWSTRPIEDIRVGDRVVAHNPELTEEERAELALADVDSMRRIELSLVKTNGVSVDIVLLRPVEWVELVGAEHGKDIELSIPELGIEGPARVRRIEEFTVRVRRGQLVTGTFRHSSASILDLRLAGADEGFGVTPNHPIWSESRLAFVAAEQLHPGEAVRLLNGTTAHVASLRNLEGAREVFNLEVAAEHVYCIGAGGMLVHNAYGLPRNILARRIIGEHGLQHSFGRHAHEWFGRTVVGADLGAWRRLIERASGSKLIYHSKLANTPTIAHLARIDGKYFVAHYTRDGQFLSAFVPSQAQLRVARRLLGI